MTLLRCGPHVPTCLRAQQDPFFLASDSDSELESEDEGLLQLPEPSETPEELPGPSCPGGAADAAAAGAEAGACGTSGAAAQGVAAAAGAAHADSRVHERSSSAGVAGPGPSSTSQQQASALLAKYHVGSKRPHEGVEGEAECQQERCGQCDGAAAPAQQRHHHHQQQQQPEQLSLAKAPRRVKRVSGLSVLVGRGRALQLLQHKHEHNHAWSGVGMCLEPCGAATAARQACAACLLAGGQPTHPRAARRRRPVHAQATLLVPACNWGVPHAPARARCPRS